MPKGILLKKLLPSAGRRLKSFCDLSPHPLNDQIASNGLRSFDRLFFCRLITGFYHKIEVSGLIATKLVCMTIIETAVCLEHYFRIKGPLTKSISALATHKLVDH